MRAHFGLPFYGMGLEWQLEIVRPKIKRSNTPLAPTNCSLLSGLMRRQWNTDW